MSGWARGLKKVQDATIGKLPKPLRNTAKFFNLGDEIVISGAKTLEGPKVPDVPGAPTIDDATKNRQEQDRLRRRRGVLANLYGGASSQSSGAGTKTLLGG